MSFGSFDSAGMTQPMAEINTTPLVDVMLVLLVIFIIGVAFVFDFTNGFHDAANAIATSVEQRHSCHCSENRRFTPPIPEHSTVSHPDH